MELRQTMKEFSLMMRGYRAHREDMIPCKQRELRETLSKGKKRQREVKESEKQSRERIFQRQSKHKDPGRSVGSVILKATQRRWISERHGRSGPGQ